MRHKHNVTMTYGNKTIKSRTSASYENTDALYKGLNYERFSLRSRNTISFSKKWSGSLDFSFRHAIKKDPHSGSPIKAANMYPSIYAGLYPDGRIAPGKKARSPIRWQHGAKAARRRARILWRLPRFPSATSR